MREENYFFVVSATAESAVIVDAESVAIVVVSVDMVAVESVVVSSVLGLLWQAANVNMLPTNSTVNIFFITFCSDVLGFRGKYSFFSINTIYYPVYELQTQIFVEKILFKIELREDCNELSKLFFFLLG